MTFAAQFDGIPFWSAVCLPFTDFTETSAVRPGDAMLAIVADGVAKGLTFAGDS